MFNNSWVGIALVIIAVIAIYVAGAGLMYGLSKNAKSIADRTLFTIIWPVTLIFLFVVLLGGTFWQVLKRTVIVVKAAKWLFDTSKYIGEKLSDGLDHLIGKLFS